jgi:thymidylate synthase (FAD)
MKIIAPSFEINPHIGPDEASGMLNMIEVAARTCYASQPRTRTAAERSAFIRSLIARGHESTIEHVSITVRFVVDRGVSHELVRHRLAAFSQQSTRYCNYSQDRFGAEITVIRPLFWADGSVEYLAWHKLCSAAESTYLGLLAGGCTPQEARSVLPNSLATTVVMTANLREWRHVLRLRTASAAHPQMREVMCPLLETLAHWLPDIFGDIPRPGQ